MTLDEGVVKFQQTFERAPAPTARVLAELDAWRTTLHRAGLIGQDPARYGGAGYGNASAKVGRGRFVITGTQTGNVARLTPEHYTMVVRVLAEENRVWTEGPVAASSESMTHAAVYAADPSAKFVFHAHSPEIWHAARKLRLPITKKEVPYGTPEMAREVDRLFRTTKVGETKAFSMGGHEDGIITFGTTGEEAGLRMVGLLAEALALSHAPARASAAPARSPGTRRAR